MEKYPLRRIRIDDIPEPSARLFDPEIDAVAKQAIDAIRTGKEEELRRWAERARRTSGRSASCYLLR